MSTLVSGAAEDLKALAEKALKPGEQAEFITKLGNITTAEQLEQLAKSVVIELAKKKEQLSRAVRDAFVAKLNTLRANISVDANLNAARRRLDYAILLTETPPSPEEMREIEGKKTGWISRMFNTVMGFTTSFIPWSDKLIGNHFERAGEAMTASDAALDMRLLGQEVAFSGSISSAEYDEFKAKFPGKSIAEEVKLYVRVARLLDAVRGKPRAPIVFTLSDVMRRGELEAQIQQHAEVAEVASVKNAWGTDVQIQHGDKFAATNRNGTWEVIVPKEKMNSEEAKKLKEALTLFKGIANVVTVSSDAGANLTFDYKKREVVLPIAETRPLPDIKEAMKGAQCDSIDSIEIASGGRRTQNPHVQFNRDKASFKAYQHSKTLYALSQGFSAIENQLTNAADKAEYEFVGTSWQPYRQPVAIGGSPRTNPFMFPSPYPDLPNFSRSPFS